MAVMSDPTYLHLYRDYAAAIRAYENAVQDRRRVRNAFAVRQSPLLQALQNWNRRPVGAPSPLAGGRAPAADRPAPAMRPAAPRVYLGPILGWARLVPSDSTPEPRDPTADADADKLYDRTSLLLYWNAKNRYEKAKRAFFDYTRRHNLEAHRERAAMELGHQADLQLLGAEGGEDSALDGARREIEAACRNAWNLYATSPEPKSDAVKKLLLRSIAEAQFVGLESTTTATMEAELRRMIASGRVVKETN